ncbi:protoporphyrinogen oxidase [Roseobacter sp. YSTF-M11]|uniref:Protoporphyrinogen oxidase n=1 Tax=Roseobacter insulae TaxID=2859783 RepID=A0A9X1G003_9RHOB|nr:flavodoxin domain-containing protein [Roseobacter insulae]MBW4710419.1 protoporphyrinogen oxidase [Roseobacter insulae]
MTILIVYASIEGQTRKIARFVEDHLKDQNCNVRVVDAGDKTVSVSFDDVDKVILAASVHERRHPKPFEVFLGAHRKELAEKETLLLSVSLSAAFPEGLAEAREYVVEMNMRTEMTPDRELYVAGAVRTSQYDYYARQVLRHVVLRGKDFDPGVDEYEFTDWDALAKDVSSFVASTPSAA